MALSHFGKFWGGHLAFWEEQGQRKLQLPISTQFWFFNIVVGLGRRLDGLVAQNEELGETASDRYRPTIARCGFPICCD